MFKRLFFLTVMMAGVGLPYVLTSANGWWSSISSSATSSDSKTAPAAAAGSTGRTSTSPTVKTAATVETPPLEGFAPQDLAEVIRFDATPTWVMARWPRVTSGLAEVDLQGYRVPLVTGTSAGDLAGSLTYYFNKNQEASFITFRGTTGDPRKLVALVVSRYSLVPQKTDDPSISLYQVKWNGKPMSELRIRTARVLRADQPNTRYQVELALKRPT